MCLFNKRTEKQRVGKKGEKIAAKYLKKQGYLILNTNYRSKRNEIDIIAKHQGSLVFVEVKTTSSDKAEEYKMPSEAVDSHKKECLRQCATDYIKEKKRAYQGYRFDVIEVYLNRDKPEINHIQNAFYIKERIKRTWNR